MRAYIYATMAALALGVYASAAAWAKSSDEDFVKNASIGGNFEIATSKLALEKSQRSDVKVFAQTMIDDHSKAGSELKTAVNSTSVDKKLADSKLDPKHQALFDKLNISADKDFDAAYIAAQKEAHAEAVALFSDYVANGDNKVLKEFASNTLPTLKKHQEHVGKF